MKIEKEKIQKMIFDRGFTINSFASQFGIKQQSLAAWLNGEYCPRPVNILKLAKALECEVSDISDISPLSKIDPTMSTRTIFPEEANPDELDDKMILLFLRDPRNKKLRDDLIYKAKVLAINEFFDAEKRKTEIDTISGDKK